MTRPLTILAFHLLHPAPLGWHLQVCDGGGCPAGQGGGGGHPGGDRDDAGQPQPGPPHPSLCPQWVSAMMIPLVLY